MGLFGGKKKPAGAVGGGSDIGRMLRGKMTAEEEIIERKLREQHQHAADAAVAERAAVAEVGEKARQMTHNLAEMRQQVVDLNAELERSAATEAQLRKALQLAADRLSLATESEGALRADLETANDHLRLAAREVTELRSRLAFEKGIGGRSKFLDALPPDLLAHAGVSNPGGKGGWDKGGGVGVSGLVSGAVPGAKDGPSVGEERKAMARQARQRPVHPSLTLPQGPTPKAGPSS